MRVRIAGGRFAALLIATASAAAGWLLTRPSFPDQTAFTDVAAVQSSAQCAHWCAYRCCQLLGAPVSLKSLVEQMPVKPGGHSLLEVKEILQSIGFECRGERRNLSTLVNGPFPCIAHLAEPDHFVVVTAVDRQGIHLFDGAGRRTIRSLQDFGREWSGVVLTVQRSEATQALPRYIKTAAGSPRIQFERLLVDDGAAVDSADEQEFVYRFKNIGTAELVVRNVSTTCSCLEADRPERPVAPGESAVIRLVYRRFGREGGFTHDAAVETNDPHFPVTVLSAAGFLDETVKILPTRVSFGNCPAGAVCRATMFVRYSGDREEFTITRTSTSLASSQLQVYGPEDELPQTVVHDRQTGSSIPARARLVEGLFEPTSAMAGPVKGIITIETDVTGFENLTVPVTANVVPPVRAIPSVLNLGEVDADEIVQAQIKVISLTGGRIRVLDAVIGDQLSRLDITYDQSVSAYEAIIEFSGSGTAAVSLAERNVRIIVEDVQSGERVNLSIPIYAVLRDRPR